MAYDFSRLTKANPDLKPFVRKNPRGQATINFSDPDAVKALNKALLVDAYELTAWDLPPGALCPGVPGRTDYVHAIADLIADGSAMPHGPKVRVLDIGTGAGAIYPIIGASEYGWTFVATETDKSSQRWARQIVRLNKGIDTLIEIRLQPDPKRCFANVTTAGETFAAAMCNPPFHASAAEAAAGTERKQRNLGIAREDRALNFGGQANELWCEGGEIGFIERMIAESATRPRLCRWFTTMVAKSEHLPRLRRALEQVRPSAVRVLEMSTGVKKTRALAWSFDPGVENGR